MRDSGSSFVFVAMEHIPVVAPNERLLVRIAWHKARLCLQQFARYKAFPSGGIVNPLINRTEVQKHRLKNGSSRRAISR